MEENICCPKFEPEKWDNQILVWNNKKFIKTRIPSFLYMPIGFGKAMTKLQKAASDAGAKIEDYLCLSDHTSKWSTDIYLAVDKDVENIENVELTGNYFCKVYEGPFKDTGKWMEDYAKITKDKGYEIKKIFMWYTTCPKCAIKYGKNYVAAIGEI